MRRQRERSTWTARADAASSSASLTGESARTIAKEVGVSLTTVTREIRKHTYESFSGCYGRANQCVHRKDCRLTLVCRDCTAGGARCAACSYRNCNKFCDKVQS